MPDGPATPLDQAIAALIAMIIAAIADQAAEHPLLAPRLHATIRQLEETSLRLQTLAREWQATRHIPTAPRPARPTTHARTPRHGAASSPRPGLRMRIRLPAVRAPPTRQDTREPRETPPGRPRTGAAAMYALSRAAESARRSRTAPPPRPG